MMNYLFYAMMMLLTGGVLGYTLGESAAMENERASEKQRDGGTV